MLSCCCRLQLYGSFGLSEIRSSVNVAVAELMLETCQISLSLWMWMMGTDVYVACKACLLSSVSLKQPRVCTAHLFSKECNLSEHFFFLVLDGCHVVINRCCSICSLLLHCLQQAKNVSQPLNEWHFDVCARHSRGVCQDALTCHQLSFPARLPDPFDGACGHFC